MHKLGIANERLCKRYFFFLEQIVKTRAAAVRKEGPPKIFYLRELYASLPSVLLDALSEQVSWSCRSVSFSGGDDHVYDSR